MGNISITQELNREKEVKQDYFDWEERFFRHACQLAQEEAREYFQELDEQLYQQHPACWQNKGLGERTLLTQFGGIRIKRRLYQDGHNYHFVLLSAVIFKVTIPMDVTNSMFPA